MALVLSQQLESSIPIEVRGVTPDALVGLSEKEIVRLPIQFGRKSLPLGELFKISGTIGETPTLVWEGHLSSVHWIGAAMSGGKILIESNAGRHIGSQMSGGEIFITGDAADFLGVEMSGGTIRVSGNAGDLAGGNYPGSKIGMNRGSILIDGNAGQGAGQSMRRGTIAIGGDVGNLAGCNMLAGTILTFGQCGKNIGAGMTRGTIVVAGEHTGNLLPTFVKGGAYPVPVLPMFSNWLGQQQFKFDKTVLKSRFQQFNGDTLKGGRGEIFVKD